MRTESTSALGCTQSHCCPLDVEVFLGIGGVVVRVNHPDDGRGITARPPHRPAELMNHHLMLELLPDTPELRDAVLPSVNDNLARVASAIQKYFSLLQCKLNLRRTGGLYIVRVY